MTVNFQEISELSSPLVRFYSVKLGSDTVSEFEKFDLKVFDSEIHKKELQIIYNTIEQIRHRGARSFYFHPEGPAEALPKVSKLMTKTNRVDYGLRLYCIYVDEYNVVLLNGDVKTTHDPTSCPNVEIHFDRALKIARKLKKAISDNLVRFKTSGIEIDESFDLDI